METAITQVVHWATLGGVVTLLGFAMRQHKVWIRMTDYVNTLWSDRCKERGDRFVSVENGK